MKKDYFIIFFIYGSVANEMDETIITSFFLLFS